MSLPYAFYQSGWLIGIVFLLLVALLSYSTMSLIIAAVHITRARLRRWKQAAVAHAAALAGMPFDAEAGAGTGYGSLNGSPAALPSGSPTTEQAVDPLDLTVILADPDFDVVGYQQVAYVAFGEWSEMDTTHTIRCT